MLAIVYSTYLVTQSRAGVLYQSVIAAAGCGRFADTYNCIKTAFHDTDILADILAGIARMSARMSVSWNAVFMQLYVSAKRPYSATACRVACVTFARCSIQSGRRQCVCVCVCVCVYDCVIFARPSTVVHYSQPRHMHINCAMSCRKAR